MKLGSATSNERTLPLLIKGKQPPQIWKRLWYAGICLLILAITHQRLASIGVNTLFLLANRLQDSLYYKQAMICLNLATYLGANQGLIQNELGVLDTKLGKSAQSIKWFDRAVKTLPTTSRVKSAANNNLALFTLSIQQPVYTERLLQTAVQTEPNNPILNYNLGVALRTSGKTYEATNALREATRIAPTWYLPYLQLSQIYLDSQQYELAEENALRAMNLQPNDRTSHLVYIHALYLQDKEPQQILRAINISLKFLPNDSILLFYQALSYRDVGKPESARRLLSILFVSPRAYFLHTRIAKELNLLGHSQ